MNRRSKLLLIFAATAFLAIVPATQGATPRFRIAPRGASPSADLVVEKSVSGSGVAGSDVSFDVTVLNLGPDDAAVVTLNDALQAPLTFVSATQNSGPAFSCSTPPAGTNGTINCTIALFPAGSSANFTFTANIPSNTPPGTNFTNTATISANTFDPNGENNSSTTSITIPVNHADIGVQKSGPSAALANSDVSYTITVFNNGPDAAISTSLTDALPGTMTFVSITQNSGPAFDCSSQPPAGSGGTVTCTIASLAANATATFTLVGHIPAGTPFGTAFPNTADVATTTQDLNDGNNHAVTSVTVSSSDLAVTKSGPATATSGGTVSWTIAVTNNGPDTESFASLVDNLPAGTTFSSLVQNTGAAASCMNPGVGNQGTVSCTFPPLASGASAQFTLIANIDPAFTGTLNNTATVSGQNADPNTNNNSQTASTAVSGSADIVVTKSGPATATAGTNITYTVMLTNAGPSTATSVSLTDNVPLNTTFVSESQTAGPTFSCTNPPVGGTGQISCTLPSLASAASATFSITVAVNPGATGSVANTANGASATPDPNSLNNGGSATTTVTSSADVSIVKTANAAVSAGTDVTYHIVVTNNGPSDAASVSMTDTLPANTTFVSNTQSGGPSFSCTNPAVGGTGTVTCSIATLTSGTTATFDIVATFAAATPMGPSSNTANVSASTPDPNAGNNSSTAVTTVSPALADISITKTPAPGPYGTGQPLTYTIVVTNGGPNPASSVTVTDTLPAGTTLQQSTPGGACSGTTVVTCNAGTLANGASATFTLTITLPSTPGPITNTAVASASAASPDPNLGNNTATSTITVIPAANIPMISPLSLLLLCIALAVAGAFVQKS